MSLKAKVIKAFLACISMHDSIRYQRQKIHCRVPLSCYSCYSKSTMKSTKRRQHASSYTLLSPSAYKAHLHIFRHVYMFCVQSHQHFSSSFALLIFFKLYCSQFPSHFLPHKVLLKESSEFLQFPS